MRFQRGNLLVFKKPSTHVTVFAAGLAAGSDDPIRVVHTYGEPGVVAEQIYAVAQGPARQRLGRTTRPDGPTARSLALSYRCLHRRGDGR